MRKWSGFKGLKQQKAGLKSTVLQRNSLFLISWKLYIQAICVASLWHILHFVNMYKCFLFKVSVGSVSGHFSSNFSCLCFSIWRSLSHLQLSPPLCLTMPLVVDAVWALWSIGAGIYDYFHTSAMEERIHTLENVLSIHQFVIAGLSAGLILLMTYILWRKHWCSLTDLGFSSQRQTSTGCCFIWRMPVVTQGSFLMLAMSDILWLQIWPFQHVI